ncbi:MAG: RNA polymerase sigma factor [Aureliella sp.]
MIEIQTAISEEIVRSASQGDRSAQARVYELLVDRVHRVVLRIVGPSDADDVTQEVFIHVFKDMHAFRFQSSFATWVHRVAVNDALQHLRRSGRRATLELDETRLSHGSHRSSVATLDMKELFELAYARLDAELRVMLELKEVEHMSYAEIAQVVGIPEGTVGSRLNRARRELRAHLTDLGWEG